MHSLKTAISLSLLVCAFPTWARLESFGSGTRSDPAKALIQISGQENRHGASLQVQVQTPLAPQSKWPQPFGSRLTLTVSCHLPSPSTMRHEHLPVCLAPVHDWRNIGISLIDPVS